MKEIVQYKRETSVQTYGNSPGYTVDVTYSLEYEEGSPDSIARLASVQVRLNFLDEDGAVTIEDAKTKAIARAREILADVLSLDQAGR